MLRPPSGAVGASFALRVGGAAGPCRCTSPKNEACTRKHARRRQLGEGGCNGGGGVPSSMGERGVAVGAARGDCRLERRRERWLSLCEKEACNQGMADGERDCVK